MKTIWRTKLEYGGALSGKESTIRFSLVSRLTVHVFHPLGLVIFKLKGWIPAS
jgi:hypothetical protein